MKANRLVYAGMFLIALATIMYEILLTRIFSVTTWYHFAFLAVSLAMLGMTAGAIIVYLQPQRFILQKTGHFQALSAFLFGVMSIVGALVHINTPLFVPADAKTTIVSSIVIAIPFLLAAFVFSGICVSLTLTRFARELHKLYAADLLGAALGCILVVVSLQFLDGITEVFFTGLLGCIAALCFALSASESKLTKISAIFSLLLALFVSVNAYFSLEGHPRMQLLWSKGEKEKNVHTERWNCFSRVRVFGTPDNWQHPLEFGYSRAMPAEAQVRQLWLDIDGSAAAIMYRFTGNFHDFDFFRYDISNLAHHVVHNGNVLVMGVGGGKDILAALVMDQKHVTGVEINNNILALDNGKFGDYTGHLDQNPKVTIVNDEARSFVARSKEKYDIIQATLVDTWAASSSGAYALTENSLYTVDAWKVFINHLTDHGVLTLTRWYNKFIPSEIYRLVTMASTTLQELGCKNPRDHIVLARVMNSELGDYLKATDGLGTILVAKSPFTPEQLDELERQCKQYGFEIVLSPRVALDPNLALAAEGKISELSDIVPFRMDPSTDNCPFFFQTTSLQHLADKRIYLPGRTENNTISTIFLLLAMVAVSFFTFYCFRLPLLLTKDRSILQGTLPLFVYFFGIGLGFMLIEISQVQRFSIFLGHPTYSLSVVLFTLLLSTGLGSLIFGPLEAATKQNPVIILSILLAVSSVFGFLTPTIISSFAAADTPTRIAVAVLTLFPLGIPLGLAFPQGMRLAFRHNQAATPWLWGINGAASVCGSVLAVVVSMFAGISTSYWLGVAFYFLALASSQRVAGTAEPPSTDVVS